MRRNINSKTCLIVWLILLTLQAATTVAAKIIYVDDDANGLNDGSSWQNAYKFLQDALMMARDGDELRVAQGVYKPDQFALSDRPNLGRAETFQLKNGVTLKGGYAGFGQPDPNLRNIELYKTILSGDLAGNDIEVNDPCDLLTEPTRFENSYNVVTGYQTDTMNITTDVLDGFTIAGGNANGPSYPHNCGGGMLCKSDSTVRNCMLTGNWASYGGGMYCGPSWCCVTEPTLVNCIFERNSACYGGGMAVGDSDPRMINCTIRGNSASEDGGGILFYNDNFTTMVNCLINDNSAGQDGGGMYCIFSFNWIVTNCTISNNSAGNLGGGMFKGYDTYMTLTNCIFRSDSDSGGTDESAHIHVDRSGNPTVNYSCIQGWTGALGGIGNFSEDPRFADPNNDDYHLKSQAGRWDANSASWVKDDVTSLCIDAGDPASPIGLEPFPNGGIINMGAYGGTAEASKSYFGEPVCETIVAGDINGDCIVNLKDFALLAFHWLEEH